MQDASHGRDSLEISPSLHTHDQPQSSLVHFFLGNALGEPQLVNQEFRHVVPAFFVSDGESIN